MTFRLKAGDGTITDLATYAEDRQGVPAITLGSRSRSYAINQGRAAEAAGWVATGDGLELPSVVTLTLELKRFGPGITRAWHRQAIEDIHEACATATAWQNMDDSREYALQFARVTQETATESSYMLDLTLWETGPATSLGAVVIIQPGGTSGPPDTGYY